MTRNLFQDTGPSAPLVMKNNLTLLWQVKRVEFGTTKQEDD